MTTKALIPGSPVLGWLAGAIVKGVAAALGLQEKMDKPKPMFRVTVVEIHKIKKTDLIQLVPSFNRFNRCSPFCLWVIIY